MTFMVILGKAQTGIQAFLNAEECLCNFILPVNR